MISIGPHQTEVVFLENGKSVTMPSQNLKVDFKYKIFEIPITFVGISHSDCSVKSAKYRLQISSVGNYAEEKD